jgi:predicted amidophosphoribosyltransferase
VTDRPTATVVRLRDTARERGNNGAIFICTNCQGVVDASDSYCRHCGARLLGVKA